MEPIETTTYHIEENTSVNENGSVSIHYLIRLFEPYTLSKKKLEETRDLLYKSFELLSSEAYIHKADFCTRKEFNSDAFYIYQDYISKNENKYFDKRLYYQHYCTLSFTTKELTFFKGKVFNPFANLKTLEQQDLAYLQTFQAEVKSCVNQIKTIRGIDVIPASEEELKSILFSQQNGYTSKHSATDIKFDKELYFGDYHAAIYAFNSNSQFPFGFNFVETDYSLNENYSGISKAFLEDVGVFFPFNHVYHQIIKAGDKQGLKQVLDDRLKIYESHKGYSGGLKQKYEKIDLFEKRVSGMQLGLCYAHFSIIIYEETKEKLNEAREALETILNRKQIIPYQAKYENAYEIFNGTILGNELLLPDYQFFLTTFKDAQNLFTFNSDFKDDENGLVFQDPLYQKPFRRDLIDLKRNRIKARNGLFVAPTGAGKSSTILNLGTQLVLDGVNIVCVEFGKSFAALVNLFPDRSAYITYEADTPLGYNFFALNNEPLNNAKIVAITNYVLKLWRLNLEIGKEKTNISTSLKKILKDYYQNISTNHSFTSFYKYVTTEYDAIVSRTQIPQDERYFDIESFRHVLSEFMPGGAYQNVTQTNDELEQKIFNSQIVVIELSQIEDDPFLISIIYTILKEVFNQKILNDRSQLAGILLDEYGKTQGLGEKAEVPMDENIHASVAQLYQVIRKELGFVWSIIQGPKQLPKNHHTENIVTNTQILGVLEGTQKVYNDIIEMFHIDNEEHINLMKSLSNKFTGKRPYSSLFLRLGENYACILRQEFCKEKFYAFQTDGDDWNWLHNDYKKTQDYPQSIENLIRYKNEN